MKRTPRDGLLPRMEARQTKKGFTYRYHPMDGKPVNLGSDKIAAVKKVLDLTGAGGDIGTVKRLWEQFQETPGWKRYSAYTRTDYVQCSGPLLEIFGDSRAADIDRRPTSASASGRPACESSEKNVLSVNTPCVVGAEAPSDAKIEPAITDRHFRIGRTQRKV